MALFQRDIIECIDKSIDDKEKEFLKKHYQNTSALKGCYTWECIRDNFGLDDEKIECVLDTYLAELNGFVVFDGDCFSSDTFRNATLDFMDF